MSIKKHIFLPGNARSGTTWVTKWLETHPNIACRHNFYLLDHALGLFEPVGPRIQHCIQPHDVRVLLDSVFDRYSEGKEIMLESSSGDISYGERSPAHPYGRHISYFIHSVYEDAYILIIYKDGKSWVHSLMNIPWKTGHTVERSVDYWISKMSIILEHTPKNTLHIKYEDLLYNDAYQDILDFLNIEHLPLVAWEEPHVTVYSEYDPDRWKSMSKEQISMMKRMNPWLKRAGYETI